MQDLLKTVSLRELRLAVLGFGTVIMVAMAASLLMPNFKAARSASQEVSVLEEASQDGNELERHLQKQRIRIEKLRFRLHGDMAELPVRQVEAYIIGRLQKISWNNEVELVSVQPTTGERVEIFQEMLFNVRLVGQYVDLYLWLREIRDDLGYVVVKEYALTRHNDDDDGPLLAANLSLASYRAVK